MACRQGGLLVKALINSFNAGEVTPLVVGRVDLENMRRACRKLSNFIPRVFGGAFRRPSMMHVAGALNGAKHSRMLPFAFSTEKKFQVELGNLSYRIFNADTGAVVAGPAAAPWTADQVDGVFFTQINNLMWLVHPEVEPHELTRIDDTNWTLAAMPWDDVSAYPPLRDVNITAATIALAATTGLGVIMNASTGIFQPQHVGSYWQISHFRDVLSSELTFEPDPLRSGATGDVTLGITTQGGAPFDPPVTVGEAWKITTEGKWSGTLFVEKYNETDLAYDVEIQREVTTGNQLSETGFGKGKFRIRVKDVTLSPGETVKFKIGKGEGMTSPQELTFTAPDYLDGTGDELLVNGRWELTTYGRWAGEMYLEQKNAAGGWDVLRRWTGSMDRNIAASGTIEGDGTLRLRGANVYAAPASDVAKPRWVLEAVDPLFNGLVKVVGYLDPQQVTVNVIRRVYSTAATSTWSEGAFSKARGFPSAVALHEQRLCFAGTAGQPQNIWCSVTGDFRNFTQTGLDDGSLSYQIGAQENNPIVWLVPQDGCIVGTEGDEWLLTGGQDKAMTPSNVQTKRQSGYGSKRIQPCLVGSTVLFVQRGGLALREYIFQWEQQNYVAPNVTQLFSHQTLAGIRAIAVSQNPEQLLWVVTTDGKLLSCTYRREEQVVAWAVHPTDGLVESVSAVYGQAASGDEIWIVVNRNGARHIERLRSGYWADLEKGNQVWHMDSAVEKTGSFSSVSGLGHLEDREVCIVADGAEMARQRVIGGAVSVPPGTKHAAVGLPFTSELWPMPFDFPLQDGTAQGRRWKVTELAVLLYKTQAGQYADGPDAQAFDLIIRQATDPADGPPPTFTGMKRLQAMGTYQDSASVVIKTSSPMPLNVLSLIPTLEVYGN